MTNVPGEIILAKEEKRRFSIPPIYLPISSTAVATIWRKPKSNSYFVAGKYLGLSKTGEVVEGQRYRKLIKTEMEIVIKALRELDLNAEVYFNSAEIPDL